MGKVAIVGAVQSGMKIEETWGGCVMKNNAAVIKSGDWITLDGNTGLEYCSAFDFYYTKIF